MRPNSYAWNVSHCAKIAQKKKIGFRKNLGHAEQLLVCIFACTLKNRLNLQNCHFRNRLTSIQGSPMNTLGLAVEGKVQVCPPHEALVEVPDP